MSKVNHVNGRSIVFSVTPIVTKLNEPTQMTTLLHFLLVDEVTPVKNRIVIFQKKQKI